MAAAVDETSDTMRWNRLRMTRLPIKASTATTMVAYSNVPGSKNGKRYEDVLEILDAQGNWIYVNDLGAQVLGHERTWFRDHNMFEEIPGLASDWREILENVALTRETYIDRTNRGLLNLPTKGDEWVWSIIAFPITLHDNRPGVVIMARTLERRPLL